MANTKVTKSLKGKPITTITTYGNYKGPFPVCTRSNSKVSLVGHKSGERAGGGFGKGKVVCHLPQMSKDIRMKDPSWRAVGLEGLVGPGSNTRWPWMTGNVNDSKDDGKDDEHSLPSNVLANCC